MTKIAYLDCISGISGDMTLAALVDAGVDLAEIQSGIDSLGLPTCKLVLSEVKRKGFRAKNVEVQYEPEHAHRHLHHITDMIDGSSLSESQKQLAVNIFTKLAEAEAKVHGSTLQKVHFHEVGAVDSIADIVGSAIGFDLLGVQKVAASKIVTGSGTIEIAHGRCSVPAPATTELLKGIPATAGVVEGELTTPTGAAIVATLAEQFGPLPEMKIQTIGYGAGQNDWQQQANILRLLVGETIENETTELGHVWLLETNLDDLSGELIGHCIDRLWRSGALDVYTSAITMKKNRPAVIISVMCDEQSISKIEMVLFQETTTLAVRRQKVCRRMLARRTEKVETAVGEIELVIATLPDGSQRVSPEYESCRSIANEKKLPIKQVFEQAIQAWR